MNAEQVAKALGGAKRGTDGWWTGKCPAHDDGKASLSLKDADDGGIAFKCMAGCSSKDVGAELRVRGLLPEREEKPKRGRPKRGKHTHTYEYLDENSVLQFEVWRYADPKGFAQRRPDPSAPGGWKWSLGDVRRVLYRLPAILAADPAQTVFLCEGEKDVDRLASLGLVATTSPQGSSSWAKADSKVLAGRQVVVLPDNDPPGRQYVLNVARDLVDKAASVRIVDLAGLPHKGDVSDWLDQGHAVAELLELATAAPLHTPGPVPDPDGRERVELTPHLINAVTRQCAGLLREVIYMRGPVPSALLRADEVRADAINAVDAKPEHEPGVMLDGVRHTKGSLVLVPPTSGLIQYQLDELAAFWRFDKRPKEWVPASCPKDLVTRLIDAATELGYRSCSAIVPLPMFIGGRIIAEPGYHAATGSIIAFDGKLPPIPERPTKAEAQATLEVLIRPFRGYLSADQSPFRTSTAAAALTAVMRPSLPSAPAINVDANVSGAGKGKYGRALSVITAGCLPALVTEGHNSEEFDKRISSAILSGAPCILLDNLQRPLEASALESILTEATATIRSFGHLSGVTVPFRALVVIAANNTVLRRDMLRRVLQVRIVVDTDEPEARQFDFDPYTEAKNDRLAILAAGFTIIRAWWQVRETEEGRRIRATTLGSFEQWADLVAGAVEWLTGINPIALIEERKAEDPKRGDERQVIAALHAYFGEATWTAKQAIGFPAQRDRFNSEENSEATGINPEVWAGVISFKGERPNAREVGKWLGKHKDTPFPGFILTGKPDRDGTMHWQVRVSRVSAGITPSESAGLPQKRNGGKFKAGGNQAGGQSTNPAHTRDTRTLGPCMFCGEPVAVGKPGYAWTPDGHAHGACLAAADAEDGELGNQHHH